MLCTTENYFTATGSKRTSCLHHSTWTCGCLNNCAYLQFWLTSPGIPVLLSSHKWISKQQNCFVWYTSEVLSILRLGISASMIPQYMKLRENESCGRWNWMDIMRQRNKKHILPSAGTVQNHGREASPPSEVTYCTLWDGKANFNLVLPLQCQGRCLQVTVLSAVVSASPSRGIRSQWSPMITDISNKIICGHSPVPFLPPPPFLCCSSAHFHKGCSKVSLNSHLLWE